MIHFRKLSSVSRRAARFWPGISAFVISAAILVTLSVWIGHDAPSGKPWTQLIWPQLIHRNFWLGFFFGIIAFYLPIFFVRKGFTEFRSHAKSALMTGTFLKYLALSVLAVAVSIWLATAVAPEDRRTPWQSFWWRVAKEPGGFFIIFTGLPTLCFLALAVQQLREIRRTISSFSELIDRVCDLADKATNANPIRILAYTPAVGYLARPDAEWDQFQKAIARKDSKGPIAEIICLQETDLASWHDLFVGRQTSRDIDLEMTREASTLAEGLLRDLQQDTHYKACKSVHRLPFDFMPGYYFFFTKDRALIVVPLFLPLPGSAPEPRQQQLPTVQMIGFETAERALIQDVEQMYDYYKSLAKAKLFNQPTALSDPSGGQSATSTDKI